MEKAFKYVSAKTNGIFIEYVRYTVSDMEYLDLYMTRDKVLTNQRSYAHCSRT